MSALDKLTEKQRQFVLHYMDNGFNATRAAIAAGYSADTACVIGSENLRKPNIREVVTELLDTHGITEEKIKVAIGQIAFGNDVADFEHLLNAGASLKDLRELGVDTSLINQVEVTHEVGGTRDNPVEYAKVKMRLYDRLTALEKLAKIRGMMVDKTQLSGPGGGGIKFEFAEAVKDADAND